MLLFRVSLRNPQTTQNKNGAKDLVLLPVSAASDLVTKGWCANGQPFLQGPI